MLSMRMRMRMRMRLRMRQRQRQRRMRLRYHLENRMGDRARMVLEQRAAEGKLSLVGVLG
jgi:hypothetical protein